MPKVPTPLPGVVEGEDLWTLEVPPEPPPTAGFRWRVPIAIATVVALFLAGAVIAVSPVMGWLPGFSAAPEAPRPVAVARPAWSPGSGPLERGVALDSEAPQALRWSPDGLAVAWVAFDSRRGVPLARSVGVGVNFGAPTVVDPMPDWVRTPVETSYRASIVGGGLVINRADGTTAGLVDLAGQYGYVEPRLPALSEAGGRVRVAFVATAPSLDGQRRATLHVLDVTLLVRPETLTDPGVPPAEPTSPQTQGIAPIPG